MTAHRKILESLSTGARVQTVDKATATSLLQAGHVRAVTIDPMPKDGVPVSLTAQGRGALAQGETPAPAAATGKTST